MASSPRDRWITWATRLVAVLVIGTLAYLAYSMYVGARQDQQGSLASRAIYNLRETVRKNPKSAQAHVLLGDAYRDTGRFTNAVEEYNKALDLEAEHPLALSGLALVAMRQEEWRTAEGYWQKAIEVMAKGQYANQDPRLEKAYYYYGTVLLELKQYEEAAATLKEALRIQRTDADTHYALSLAYKGMELPGKQRESLQNALLFVPDMPEANYDMAMLYLADDDKASAAEHLRRAIDGAPERKEPAEELEKLGPFEDRMAEAKKLADTDLVAALGQARIAAALEPKDVPAVRLVAQLLQKIGSPEDEKNAWQRVIDLVPDDAEATQALAALNSGS